MDAAQSIDGLRAPRFDGASLLNLAATLETALGNASPYPLLADVALRERVLAARRIVLWVIDGLGVEPLQRLAPRSALAGAMASEVSALFPSSTAPTLTTFNCARSPAAHAVPEWFLWFDELGAVYRSLPLDARSPASGLPPLVDATAVYAWTSMYRRADRPAFVVLPLPIAYSAYSRHAHAGAVTLPFGDERSFVEAIVAAIDDSRDGAYVYAYVDEFDRTAHEFGVASDEARAVVGRLDRVFRRLADELTRRDVLLLVTADHGFVDIEPEARLRLEHFPRLAACLAAPLCGGPRVPICRVRPECVEAVAAVVDVELGGRFACVPSEALIAAGWFGPDAPDPRLRSRLGSHVLLPRDGAYLVDCVAGEPAIELVGVHGGLSDAESRVPVIVAST